jgi:hypothetical protein
MQEAKRIRFMSDTYMAALRTRGGAKYVWPFAMLDSGGRHIAWLFFCTNNPRGLEEMKKAMWKVDQTGGFSFSDEHGLGQMTLLNRYSDDALATEMKKGLMGKTLTVEQVKEWVLVETPAYRFKNALKILESDGFLSPVNAPPNRKVGQFPANDMLLKFQKPDIPTSLFG